MDEIQGTTGNNSTLFRRIEKGLWWDEGIQLIDGCTPVSPACVNCWSASTAKMGWTQKGDGEILDDQGKFNGNIRIHPERIKRVLKNKKPTVYSIWNDLMHVGVPSREMRGVYSTAAEAFWHKFIICTKRPEMVRWVLYDGRRVSENYGFLSPNKIVNNVIHMTTGETNKLAHWRTKVLGDIKKHNPDWKTALNMEPILEEIDLKPLFGIEAKSIGGSDGTGVAPIPAPLFDWALIGAESGPSRRPFSLQWVYKVVQDCDEVGIPIFVKQLIINGRLEKDLSKFPPELQRRDIPEWAW